MHPDSTRIRKKKMQKHLPSHDPCLQTTNMIKSIGAQRIIKCKVIRSKTRFINYRVNRFEFKCLTGRLLLFRPTFLSTFGLKALSIKNRICSSASLFFLEDLSIMCLKR